MVSDVSLSWNISVITDLDAQATRIRDYRTRTYFTEALKCFRAGAYRAAVSAIWVTVAYDIIAKYRELSTLGDREARIFIDSWDHAATNNQTPQLLKLERSLLDHAHEKMAIIDSATCRALKRLQEDRHLCAHPAFTTESELYDPPAELVRAHMSISVESLLSQPPVQGRGIIEVFSADIQSSGFPTSPDMIADYVEQKYIRNMRQSVVRNFGIALLKSVIRNIPSDWKQHRSKVLFSLSAIKNRAPNHWPDIEKEIIRLIDDDEPGSRTRALAILGHFPELVKLLSQPAMIALQQVCNNIQAVRNEPEIFLASTIEEFRDLLVKQFEALEDADAAAVLSALAVRVFWPSSLERLARSSSFRGAEARFDQFIAPFAPLVDDGDLSGLFNVIEDNGQIWDAAGIPMRLLKILELASPRRPSDEAANSLYRSVGRLQRENYSDVWLFIEKMGWKRPTLSNTDTEDPFF